MTASCSSSSTTSSRSSPRRRTSPACSARARDCSSSCTSREPLRIAPEREYPLKPLPEAPAIELFRQRVAAVAPAVEVAYDARRGHLRPARPPTARDRARRGAREGASNRRRSSSAWSNGCRCWRHARGISRNDSERSAGRSPGATSCWTPRSSSCSGASPSSQEARRSRRSRPSATPTISSSRRSWTRACCAGGATASSCSRRSASSRRTSWTKRWWRDPAAPGRVAPGGDARGESHGARGRADGQRARHRGAGQHPGGARLGPRPRASSSWACGLRSPSSSSG